MKRHSIPVTAQCAYEGPNGRCKRMTTITHPYCGKHTQDVYGLKVAKSNIPGAGLGLFALRPFALGEHIVEYYGEKMTQKEYNLKYDDDALGAYGIELNSRYVLDAAKTSCGIARYACDYHGSRRKPNAEYVSDKGRIWVVAVRPIKAGDEILTDYGDEMHRALGLK
ncbi:MAG: SET domain-containing protein ['Candidatus Kapabacteria' thiocyanatum]|nr:SET domain-containing protein ['Candidatus Kapabacteria' thiocyanatum]